MEPGVSGATWLAMPPGNENCLNQALHALGVLADVRVNLAVSALEVGVRHKEIAAVTRTGQQDHIQIILLDDAVQMNVNQVLTGHRAPVADDLLLDVLGFSGSLSSGLSSR